MVPSKHIITVRTNIKTKIYVEQYGSDYFNPKLKFHHL